MGGGEQGTVLIILNMLLKGKVAIVTGSAKGIGRCIATEMAREGAHVVIADIDEKNSKITQKMLKTFGNKSLTVCTDVSIEKDNNELVDVTLRTFGKIDILINNAGINTRGGITEIGREEAISVFNTNLIGPFFLTQRVVNVMIKKEITGSILFTSSIHSHITQLHPAYSSSKAALEMFVKDIALELAEYGIRVNAVSPGAIAIRGEKNRKNIHVPLGYSGTPQDIANVMVFLASEKGNYITGQAIVVDGGFSLAHTHYWTRKGLFDKK